MSRWHQCRSSLEEVCVAILRFSHSLPVHLFDHPVASTSLRSYILITLRIHKCKETRFTQLNGNEKEVALALITSSPSSHLEGSSIANKYRVTIFRIYFDNHTLRSFVTHFLTISFIFFTTKATDKLPRTNGDSGVAHSSPRHDFNRRQRRNKSDDRWMSGDCSLSCYTYVKWNFQGNRIIQEEASWLLYHGKIIYWMIIKSLKSLESS